MAKKDTKHKSPDVGDKSPVVILLGADFMGKLEEDIDNHCWIFNVMDINSGMAAAESLADKKAWQKICTGGETNALTTKQWKQANAASRITANAIMKGEQRAAEDQHILAHDNLIDEYFETMLINIGIDPSSDVASQMRRQGSKAK